MPKTPKKRNKSYRKVRLVSNPTSVLRVPPKEIPEKELVARRDRFQDESQTRKWT